MKHTRVTKSWSRYNVPQDLWPEILSRLPVKSLVRFRCVSRSWQSLINDPDFRCLHLNHFRNNCDEAYLFAVQGFEHHCIIRCSESFEITEKLGCLRRQYRRSKKNTATATLFDGHWDILFSIDGLVLLRRDSHCSNELMLWNPSIRKSRRLPPSPVFILHGSDLGLGFDPLINDYKILRAGWNHEGSRVIAVYTVGTNSWKTIQLSGKQPSGWHWPPCSRILVHSRGKLYFMGLNGRIPKAVVSFNLSSETFASIPLPADENISLRPNPNGLMFVDGGCTLAAFYCSPIGKEASIWVLEGSGDNGTSMHWTKRCTFAPRVPGFLYMKKNGDMLLGRRKVIMYNMETRREKQPNCMNALETRGFWGYKESLFLLD